MNILDLFRRKERRVTVSYRGYIEPRPGYQFTSEAGNDQCTYLFNDEALSVLWYTHIVIQDILKESITRTILVTTRKPKIGHFRAVRVKDTRWKNGFFVIYQPLTHEKFTRSNELRFCGSKVKELFGEIPNKLYIIPNAIKL